MVHHSVLRRFLARSWFIALVGRRRRPTTAESDRHWPAFVLEPQHLVCFSPRIDQLVESVQKTLGEGHWYSRFEDPGLLDEVTLNIFDLSTAIISPESYYVVGQRFIGSVQVLLPQIPFSLLYLAQPLVTQREECTPATQEYLTWLMALCDSVLFNYLSKFADSSAKRDRLWVAHTIERQYDFSRWDFARASRFLDFHPSDFPLPLGSETFSMYSCLRQKC